MDQYPACMTWALPPSLDDPDEWDVRQWQAGRCGICGIVEVTTSQRNGFVLDHDHGTGRIRGYLCRRCNAMEIASVLPAFVRWRSGWNPAALMGADVEYVGFDGRTDRERAALHDRAMGPEPTMDELREAINRLTYREEDAPT